MGKKWSTKKRLAWILIDSAYNALFVLVLYFCFGIGIVKSFCLVIGFALWKYFDGMVRGKCF